MSKSANKGYPSPPASPFFHVQYPFFIYKCLAGDKTLRGGSAITPLRIQHKKKNATSQSMQADELTISQLFHLK